MLHAFVLHTDRGVAVGVQRGCAGVRIAARER